MAHTCSAPLLGITGKVVNQQTKESRKEKVESLALMNRVSCHSHIRLPTYVHTLYICMYVPIYVHAHKSVHPNHSTRFHYQIIVMRE